MKNAYGRAPIPFETRKAVLKRANYVCEDCGGDRPLEMHHLTYNLMEATGWHRDFGDLIFGREKPENLEALCRDCHRGRHMTSWGEFIVDPNERDGRVDQFEREMFK
jgi:5-methylcytosine-specific restriction endonuclease McrA